jgi:two-component system, cell cycle sensor histidine kinase and response regulator CckA
LIGVSITSPEKGWVEMNETTCRMLGYSKQELSGLTWAEMTHPDDLAVNLAYFQRLIAGDIDTYRMDKRFIRKDGKIIWVDLAIGCVRNDDGSIKYVVAFIQDISERVKQEKALAASEKRFRDLAELLPQGIFECDASGTLTYVNPTFKTMRGYSLDDNLIGLDTVELVIPEERPRVSADIQKIVDGQNIELGEYAGLKKDGGAITVMVNATPIFEDGEATGIRGVVSDITPLKRTESERNRLQEQLFHSQKLASLGTLVGGIAHDFNNMLQCVIGYSELVMDDRQLGTESKLFLRNVQNTAAEGAELVEKLLAFGQQYHVATTTFDLNDQLRQLSTMISRSLPNIVQVDLNLVDGRAMIRGDKGQVDQVVMNLAINASEAMPNGGNLTISTLIVSLDDDYCKSHIEAKPGDFVMLSVKDTGKGIDREMLSRIFDPFFSTKERGATRGTGLGLSVVRGIIQQRGGHITCESQPGKGTEFKAYFPLIEAPASEKSRGAITNRPLTGKTVLVVEDNETIAELEQKVLEKEGFKIIIASNGLEAVEIYQDKKGEISLVLLDLIMPQMTGKDCLMELVKLDPSVNVLIVSGYTPNDSFHDEIRPFVRGFVHKPYKNANLIETVKVALLERES